LQQQANAACDQCVEIARNTNDTRTQYLAISRTNPDPRIQFLATTQINAALMFANAATWNPGKLLMHPELPGRITLITMFRPIKQMALTLTGSNCPMGFNRTSKAISS
jgi:hypothetical protein